MYWLSKQGNLALSKKDPADYMKWILGEQTGLRKKELRQRVQSHLVPYDIITGENSVEERYKAFIEARAKLVADKVKALSELPGRLSGSARRSSLAGQVALRRRRSQSCQAIADTARLRSSGGIPDPAALCRRDRSTLPEPCSAPCQVRARR